MAMSSLTSLAWARPQTDGWIGSWSPGIGDPTIGGWVTVGFYALAIYLCWRVIDALPEKRRRLEGMVWRVLFWLLVGMGINKQLDLQSALTELGRIVAFTQGWYGERQWVQRAFVISVVAFALVLSLALARLTRRLPLPTRTSVFGWIVLMAFVAIRAASFHHFDVFIGHEVLGARVNWVMEVGALLIICLGAHRRLKGAEHHPVRVHQIR